jgi:hypothetical protein
MNARSLLAHAVSAAKVFTARATSGRSPGELAVSDQDTRAARSTCFHGVPTS